MTKNHDLNPTVFDAIVLTAQICGAGRLPDKTVVVMCADLSGYPEDEVVVALARCRKEVKGRLALADIIERIPDRWPSAEEAWAIVAPIDNEDSVVAPREAVTALGEVQALKATDSVAARMSFRDAYRRHVQAAKDCGEVVPEWVVSVGSRKGNLEAVLIKALDAGQITLEDALRNIGGEAADRIQLAHSRRVEAPRLQPVPIRGFLSEPADVTRWRAWCAAWGRIGEEYAQQVREASRARVAELLEALGQGPRSKAPLVDWRAEEARLAELYPAPADIDDLPFVSGARR